MGSASRDDARERQIWTRAASVGPSRPSVSSAAMVSSSAARIGPWIGAGSVACGLVGFLAEAIGLPPKLTGFGRIKPDRAGVVGEVCGRRGERTMA